MQRRDPQRLTTASGRWTRQVSGAPTGGSAADSGHGTDLSGPLALAALASAALAPQREELAERPRHALVAEAMSYHPWPKAASRDRVLEALAVWSLVAVIQLMAMAILAEVGQIAVRPVAALVTAFVSVAAAASVTAAARVLVARARRSSGHLAAQGRGLKSATASGAQSKATRCCASSLPVASAAGGQRRLAWRRQRCVHADSGPASPP